MAKHTPGPFFAWDDGRTIGIVVEPDGKAIAVAEVVDHGDMASEERLLADQQLFAATHRMLEALSNIVLSSKANDHGSLMNAIDAAEEIVQEFEEEENPFHPESPEGRAWAEGRNYG